MKRQFLFFVFLLQLAGHLSGQEINRLQTDSLKKLLVVAGKDEDRIDLLLQLAQSYLFRPGEFSSDLDSAAGLIKEAEKLNSIIHSNQAEGHILLAASYLAKEKKDMAKGKQLLEQAIRILEKGNDWLLLGNAYMSLADYYNIDYAAELPDRMRAFKQAIAVFDRGGHIGREAYAYQMLAETDSSEVTTEEELNKSLALYNSIHYPALQGVYDLFASLYILRSNFPEALKWGLKAVKTAEAVGDSTMQLCEIDNHIAIIYQHGRDSASAVKYYRDALLIAERYNDKNTVYLLIHNIATIYFDEQRPAPARDLLLDIQTKYGPPDKKASVTYYRYICDLLKVYTLLSQFRTAETYYQQLLNVENESQLVNSELSDTYVVILEYLLASGQYNRMLPYLKKDEASANAYGNPRNIARLHLLWFSYDTSRHDYQSAVSHLLQSNRLGAMVSTRARDLMLKELQVQFDTKKKEDRIALLDKESQLEKANLKEAVLARNMTVTGIIAVLIIAGLLYRQNRIKQKNNNVITKKNLELQEYLVEKEWLLKEIHHRVKNNLQIVMSLLNSQSAYIDNETALTAIQDSQHRVHAMSLIHQKLYNSEDLSSIEVSVYIRELISYLSDSFNTWQRIRFEYDIDPLEMDVSQAVPLGLILNEAITNSIKYAFPDQSSGKISISLSRTSSDHCLLIVTDDGIGIPPDYSQKKIGSLGMSLMRGLSEDLDGHFSIENRNGTIIKISFICAPGIKHALSQGPYQG